MTLTQIEKEAGKVQANIDATNKNKRRLFINGLRDLLVIAALVAIVYVVKTNIKRIDDNTKIIADKVGISYSTQTNGVYGKPFPYIGVISEKVILK